MRAAVYQKKGPASEVLRIEDLTRPEPGDDEVRVRVHFSAVNPTDCKARAAGERDSRSPVDRAHEMPWPYQVPNQDGAGVIDAVGQGVLDRRVGERVWVYHAAAEGPAGTAAEYTCVPQAKAVAFPDSVSMVEAAGVGIPYITAHRTLFADGPIAGSTVLVTGGAGAVGYAAVHLARRAGATVIATVSSSAKGELARAAGAHAIVNYRADDVEAQLRYAAPDGIDRVSDVAFIENVHTYLPLLNTHATIASYATPDTAQVSLPVGHLRRENLTVRFVGIYKLRRWMYNSAIQDITAAIEDETIRSYPRHRFSLDQIATAHEAVERGVVGKVLVDLSE